MINLNEDKEFILIKDFDKFPKKNTNDRLVYINKNQNICLKIPKDNKNSILGTKSEITFYNSLSKSAKNIFSKPLGIIDTNLGKAYIFELIKNDENISITLDSYIKKYAKNKDIYDKYISLVNLIIKNKIKIHKFHAENAVVKIKNNKIIDIIIIDYEFSKINNFFFHKIIKKKLYKKYVNVFFNISEF